MIGIGGGLSASFVYDGDGNRVKGVVGALTRTYIGNYFEWTGSTDTMKRYYYAGSVRVAVKTGGSPDQSPVLNWLFGDHLGSTSRAANANGTSLTNGELRYKAWGEKRFPADLERRPHHVQVHRAEAGNPAGRDGWAVFLQLTLVRPLSFPFHSTRYHRAQSRRSTRLGSFRLRPE